MNSQCEVRVSSIDNIPRSCLEWKPTHIVSAICSLDIRLANVDYHEAVKSVKTSYLDIDDIYNVQLKSYKDAIRLVLAADSERVLIHCRHGKSRSAALVIAKLYQQDSSGESVVEFLDGHSEAEPNPLILLFADEILKAGGHLLSLCRGRYKGSAL